MWEFDHNESWAPKNWCFWTVVLEKTLESPLDCKEIQPVNPKGNQPWIFIGRTDAEAPIIWSPDAKSWITGKGSRRRGWQKMRWMDGIMDSKDLSLNKLGHSEGQGGLLCWTSCGCAESDMTEQLNNNNFLGKIGETKRKLHYWRFLSSFTRKDTLRNWT